MMDQERIGKFIKNLRLQNHLTQKQFAEMLGVTYQAVSKWETGKNIPDITLLQEISDIFNVDMNEILTGKLSSKTKFNRNQKKTMLIIFLSILALLGIVICIIYCKQDSSYEFRTLTTTCDDFSIKGSAAYNKEKSSIYISNITYCGKQNDTIYQKIECTLYESYKDTKIKISSCPSNSIPETLSDFLKGVELSIDNYIASCKQFSNSNLYLELLATDKENQTISYKIPIQLENCSTK